jgi:quercetin dioxygenase-like cupin family protein
MTKPLHSHESQVQFSRTNGSDWKPLNEPGVSGISVKVLRFDKGAGRAPTFLLKFEPGATYPAHNHPAGEEVFVLEGEVTFGEHHLVEGDYIYTPPGGKHAVWSKQGCVMLLCVPEEVVILKNAHTGSPSR